MPELLVNHAAEPEIDIIRYQKIGMSSRTLYNKSASCTPKRVRKYQFTVYCFLERPSTLASITYHSCVFFLILASLTLSVLGTVERYQNDPQLARTMYYIELSLVIIFSLEYFLRLWSSSCHGTYKGFWGKFRFIRKPYMVIDIIVIIATIAVIITVSDDSKNDIASISIFRFVRFLQVLRILRLDRQSGAFKIVSNVVYEHRQELLTCWYMSFIILIASSFLVYLAEKSEGNTPQMENLADGVYFGVITLLTIGYGDISPKHWVSKMIVCVFSFVGVAFFALPSGILGSGFALQVAQQQRQKHINRRRNPAALVVQYAWKCFAAHPTFHGQFTWVPHLYHLMEKKKLAHVNSTGHSNVNSPGLPRKRAFKKRTKNHPQLVVRRSSIGATIPSALELRDRCMSEGNLVYGGNLLVGWKDNLEDNQATIVSLPPALLSENEEGYHYKLSVHAGKMFLPPRLLTPQEKNAIRFIRKVKLNVMIRKFKEVRRPYDVKDVIEQYSEGQLEMFGFIKKFQRRVEAALGIKEGDAAQISNMSHRLQSVEMRVESIDAKLDTVIRLLGGAQHGIHAGYRSGSVLAAKEDLDHDGPGQAFRHQFDTNLDILASLGPPHYERGSSPHYDHADPSETVLTDPFPRRKPSTALIDPPPSLARIFSQSLPGDTSADEVHVPLRSAGSTPEDGRSTVFGGANASLSWENLMGSKAGFQEARADEARSEEADACDALANAIALEESRVRSESRFTVTRLREDSFDERAVLSRDDVEMQSVSGRRSTASVSSHESHC